MNKVLFALIALIGLALPAIAADCSTTECACMLITYHDPAAPTGSDIVTDKFSWQESAGRINRRLGKYEALVVQFSYESNGVQACCNVIDNQGAQAPWAGFTMSHFAPLNGDRRGLHIFLYAQTPEYAEWEIVTTGDLTNAVDIPPHTVVDNSLIENLLITADSRLISLSNDQTLIDEARLLLTANRNSLLDGC